MAAQGGGDDASTKYSFWRRIATGSWVVAILSIVAHIPTGGAGKWADFTAELLLASLAVGTIAAIMARIKDGPPPDGTPAWRRPGWIIAGLVLLLMGFCRAFMVA